MEMGKIYVVSAGCSEFWLETLEAAICCIKSSSPNAKEVEGTNHLVWNDDDGNTYRIMEGKLHK